MGDNMPQYTLAGIVDIILWALGRGCGGKATIHVEDVLPRALPTDFCLGRVGGHAIGLAALPCCASDRCLTPSLFSILFPRIGRGGYILDGWFWLALVCGRSISFASCCSALSCVRRKAKKTRIKHGAL